MWQGIRDGVLIAAAVLFVMFFIVPVFLWAVKPVFVFIGWWWDFWLPIPHVPT